MEIAVVDSQDLPETREWLVPDRFEDFYRATWTDVFRPLAVTLHDPDLAREATDEAMTRAYERWRKVRRFHNPTGWVYRVALNWARSRYRKLRREVGPVGHDIPSWDPPVAEPAIFEALRHLSIDHRAVVVLRYLLDWSQEDVALALGIPVGTVRSRLHRALQKLREEVAT